MNKMASMSTAQPKCKVKHASSRNRTFSRFKAPLVSSVRLMTAAIVVSIVFRWSLDKLARAAAVIEADVWTASVAPGLLAASDVAASRLTISAFTAATTAVPSSQVLNVTREEPLAC